MLIIIGEPEACVCIWETLCSGRDESRYDPVQQEKLKLRGVINEGCSLKVLLSQMERGENSVNKLLV